MNVVNEIFDEFHSVCNEIEMSLDDMKRELEKYHGKVCLYGAGSAGIAFLYYLRRIAVEPAFFVDKNAARWGTVCEGVEVIGPEQIVEKVGKDALVIVTINTDGKRYCKSFADELRRGGHTGVHRMLHELGIENVVDYTCFRRCHELFQGDPYNMPSCSDVYLMDRHMEEIQEVYDHLADDLSREVYEKILRFRLIDDSIVVPTMPQDKQYFEYGFYPKREDEVFVDCGAFNGISSRTFFQENQNQFDGYYGFEPDPINYEALRTYVASLPMEMQNKMKILDQAVYDSDKGVQLYELNGPGSFVADIGKTRIDTVTIDQVINGNKATYIKMNIEGSELPALRGAKNTIAENHPRLAIAGYHKTWDLWEVPLQILQIDSRYKFYLRSYMNHISFVYYAI